MRPEPIESPLAPVEGSSAIDAPALHPASETRRARTLRQWLDSEIEVSAETVALPECGCRLQIHRPSPTSRAELFKQARADPERQMPYWADIWPSGIAMGDMAARYRDQLAGARVLELGSGLGVTAAATLRAGAEVFAVDYTPLALALCRYNALVNVGSAPRTLAVNWRALKPGALERLRAAGPFPIIMAADVLYESRDIEPLIELVTQLLEPDGMLWLSEPRRKVAARFLDTLALRGWRFTTYSFNGPWHGQSTDPVNVHFLRRQAPAGLPYDSIGGWRI